MRSWRACVLCLLLNARTVIGQSEGRLSVAATHSPAAGRSGLAPICDGSEMRSAHYRGMVGNGLLVGSLGLGVYAASSNHGSPRRAMSLFASGLGVALVGAYLHWAAHPGDDFWSDIVARARPGETSSLDVQRCLRAPDEKSASLSDETWTYFQRRPVFEGPASSEFRSVSFTFRDSLLVNVRRTDARVPNDGRPIVPTPLPGQP